MSEDLVSLPLSSKTTHDVEGEPSKQKLETGSILPSVRDEEKPRVSEMAEHSSPPVYHSSAPHKMPPAYTKKTSIHRSNRLHPYMTRPVSFNSPRSTAGPWQPEDDAQLIEARKSPLDWADISKQYFPSKTANTCRKRHERLIEKGLTVQDRSIKFQEMAKGYVEHREEMWTILAKAIGESWMAVETKVSKSY